jgi:hypothetical protein
VSNGENECQAFYDENKKLIYSWQTGDDLTRCLRALFSRLNIDFETKQTNVEEFPQTLK